MCVNDFIDFVATHRDAHERLEDAIASLTRVVDAGRIDRSAIFRVPLRELRQRRPSLLDVIREDAENL